jgi:hypothetical protein
MRIYQRPPHIHFSTGHRTSTAHPVVPILLRTIGLQELACSVQLHPLTLRETITFWSTRNCLNWLLHTAHETQSAVQHSSPSSKCGTFIKQHHKIPALDVGSSIFNSAHSFHSEGAATIDSLKFREHNPSCRCTGGGGGRAMQVAWTEYP